MPSALREKKYYLILVIIILFLLENNYVLFYFFEDVGAFFSQFSYQVKALIPSCSMINEVTAPTVVYFPLLIAAFLFYLVILKHDHFPMWYFYLVLVCLISLNVMFVVLLTLCLNFDNVVDFSITFTIWITNILFFFYSSLHYLCLFWRTDRTKQADELSKLIVSGIYVPEVDILIPTYNESAEVLKRTITGCQAIDYPKKRVYILDDGRRNEINDLAKELNCFYLTRLDNNNAKAGNLNCALEKTNSELIVVFDADFIPTKNFLRRTVGFLYDENVGMVLAPQHFYNLEAVNRNLNLENIYEMDGGFWHQMQPGKDAFNALLCHGTCFIVRRKAIEGTGGIPTETLAEDWAISIKLQASGYKTYYLNEILAAGDATEFIPEFLKQRLRWCQGILQTIYSSANPLRVKGLNFLQRWSHLSSIVFYLSFLPNLGLVFVPFVCMFFDVSPYKASLNQMMFFGFPFYITNILIGSWISERYSSRLVGNIQRLILLFPMAVVVFKTLINPFTKIFRVTRKGLVSDKATFNISFAIPLIVLATIYALAIFYAIMSPSYPTNDYYLFFCFWSLYNLFCIWMGILALVDIPQKRIAIRFNHSLPCELFVSNKTYSGSTIDLSDAGVFFRVEEQLSKNLTSLIGKFSISQLGLKNIEAKIVWNSNNALALQFVNLTLKEYRSLVDFLYCQPGQWKCLRPSEGRIYWESLKILFGFSSLWVTRHRRGVLSSGRRLRALQIPD